MYLSEFLQAKHFLCKPAVSVKVWTLLLRHTHVLSSLSSLSFLAFSLSLFLLSPSWNRAVSVLPLRKSFPLSSSIALGTRGSIMSRACLCWPMGWKKPKVPRQFQSSGGDKDKSFYGHRVRNNTLGFLTDLGTKRVGSFWVCLFVFFFITIKFY